MIPSFKQLFYPILEHYSDGHIHTAKDIREYIYSYFSLTEDEIKLYTKDINQPVIYKRVLWANTYLNQAGLIKRIDRGRFIITSLGKTLLESGIKDLSINDLQKYPNFIQKHKSSKVIADRPQKTMLQKTAHPING